MRANPYTHLGRPVRDFRNFFGRKYALSKVTNDIRNGQCVSLVGIPRIGKTSLLLQTLDAQARSVYELKPEIVCVYVTCARIPSASSGVIYSEIARKVRRQVNALDEDIIVGTIGEELSYRDFEKQVMAVHDAGLRLVLLLDDFELLANNQNLDIDFFLGLRALHMEYDLTYVTASLSPIMELTFSQKGVLSSPFPNIFDSVRLGLFSELETREFIQLADVFAPETEEFLVNLTGGHPLALQHACHFAFARRVQTEGDLKRKDQLAILSQAAKAMESHYRSYWRRLTLEQKRVLAAPAYFATHAQENTPTENLFKDLLTQGLLVRHSNGSCYYAGRLLEDFVRQEMLRDDSLRISLTDGLVGKTLDKYQITERIGHGGMGDVYKAYDPDLARDVVIKVMLPHLALDDNFSARFRREAQAIASLRHPNVIQIYGFGQQDAICYMVMEYIPGCDLRIKMHEIWGKNEKMSISTALRIFSNIGAALSYAHNNNVLHRDVKPSNVMLNSSGEAILTDFGLAKIMAGTENKDSTSIGTPAYMAPEKANQEYPIDHRADIYSLGVVLYEMLTGQTPFEGDNPWAILYQHQYKPMPDPRRYRSEIPEGLVQVLEKALAKTPERRYQSVEAMSRDLEAVEVRPEPELPGSGIPSDLYARLFDALLTCGPVNTDRDLRAMFVDASLRPWRNMLFESDSPESRSRNTIDLLYEQQNSVGENALVLFLRVLAKQKSASDSCYQKLLDLAVELESVVNSN
jgi:serine/threonine-protein kinase